MSNTWSPSRTKHQLHSAQTHQNMRLVLWNAESHEAVLELLRHVKNSAPIPQGGTLPPVHQSFHFLPYSDHLYGPKREAK